MYRASVALTVLLLLGVPALIGDTAPSSNRRDIRGGGPATVYEYPFVVILVGDSAPPRVCTRTLIGDSWVITAAHCADGFRSGEHSFESDLAIAHGYPLYTEVRHATEIELHSAFDPLTGFDEWEHDVALVRLNEPFRSRTAAAATLAGPDESPFLLPGTMTTSVGWGGANAESMTTAEWALQACPETPSAHLCTPNTTDVGMESGDSGGPLLICKEGAWIQIGVHSSINVPGGYQRHVRIAEHREWIQSVLDGNEADPGPCVSDGTGADGLVPPPPSPPSPSPGDIVIDLGASGERIILRRTESGGFTRDGAPFSSGTRIEAGGNTYKLTLANGVWTAEYVPPLPQVLGLGLSGEAVLITRREDGRHQTGAAIFQSGDAITASNGSRYRLALDGGQWTATYLPPPPVLVALGTSAETVQVERLEGGGHSVGGRRVVDGSTVYSADGTAYRLVLRDGVWKAELVEP